MTFASVKDYVRIARFQYWVKNIFVLPGATFAILVKHGEARFSLTDLIIALLATGFIASANYVLNEYLDAEFDRHHPSKKERPGALNKLNPVLVALEYVALAGVGLALGATLNFSFVASGLFLLFMGVLYNVPPIRLKDRAYLDVLSESINNPIRFLLGWYAFDGLGFPPSSALLAYWMGGAFLMSTKRYAEYRYIKDPERARLYRRSFAFYSEQILLLLSFFYAVNSALFVGILLVKYRIEYILAFPVIAILFVSYLHVATKQDSAAQSPEKLYREYGLMAITGLLVLVLVVLTIVDIPAMNILMEPINIRAQ